MPPLGFIIMVCGLMYSYYRREQPERLLFLSLIGWYLLGGFSFNRLPVGALIGIIMLRIRVNRVNHQSRLIAFLTGFMIYVLKLASQEL